MDVVLSKSFIYLCQLHEVLWSPCAALHTPSFWRNDKIGAQKPPRGREREREMSGCLRPTMYHKTRSEVSWHSEVVGSIPSRVRQRLTKWCGGGSGQQQCHAQEALRGLNPQLQPRRLRSSREATGTVFFGVTWLGIEPTTSQSQGEQSTTRPVSCL